MENITTDDLIKFYNEYYIGTEATIMGVCGDVERGTIIEIIEVCDNSPYTPYFRVSTTNSEYPVVTMSRNQVLREFLKIKNKPNIRLIKNKLVILINFIKNIFK